MTRGPETSAGRFQHGLGRTLAAWGLDGLAATALRGAVRRNPHCVDCHFILGEALLRRRCWRDAREAFLEVLRRAPGNAEAIGNLAFACAREGAVDRAVRALARLGELRPRDPAPDLLAGALLKRQRRYPEAIAAFRRAARLPSEPRAARFVLGEALLGTVGWARLVEDHAALRAQSAPRPANVGARAPHAVGGTPAAPARRPLRPVGGPAMRIRRLLRAAGSRVVELYLVANGVSQIALGRLLASQRRPHDAIRSFRQASALRHQRLDPDAPWHGGSFAPRGASLGHLAPGGARGLR
jgi:tetratricopeptide (TPR) repeat protein